MTRRLATKTVKVLEDSAATSVLNHLIENVEWEDGVRSKKGFTRKAKSICSEDKLYKRLRLILEPSIQKVKPKWVNEYDVLGMYINFYENGEMYTPTHSHPGQHQFVLSLGCERPLVIGKKSYVLKNGEGVLFGSSPHGVPKGDYSSPRISVALFMVPRSSESEEDEDDFVNGMISLSEIKASPLLSALTKLLQEGGQEILQFIVDNAERKFPEGVAFKK